MARVKGAVTTRARHKKVLKRAKGYYGAKSIRFRMANQAVMKSLNYAYVGRRLRKRDFRKLYLLLPSGCGKICLKIKGSSLRETVASVRHLGQERPGRCPLERPLVI